MSYIICYISTAKYSIQTHELDHVYKITLKNNFKKNISGILIFNNGHFFQILEGEETVLKELFKKIKSDERHHNIIILLDKKNNHRIFEDYRYGFSVITNKKDIIDLKKYLKILKDTPEFKTIRSLLKPFIK